MKFLFDFIATIWVLGILVGLAAYTIKQAPEQVITVILILLTIFSFVWLFIRKMGIDK